MQTSSSISLNDAALSLRAAIQSATQGLIERETLADLIILSAVASEHVLVIGPPGTAKSAVVRRVAQALGGQYFEYLLGRFTEPSEIFGPIDLRKLRDGTIETETAGMLPEADIAFLDEVFLGSTAVLNTLLGLLNERTFRRGHTKINCPLRVCVGAANALPEDESLAAFADRFLVHSFIEAVPDSMLEALLEGGWRVAASQQAKASGLECLDVLTQAARATELSGIQTSLAHCIRLLRKAGVELSDRRIVKSQMLISSAAVLAGRNNPNECDLWPLIYVIPTPDGQQTGREVLRDMLQAADNPTLNAVTEDATDSPASRARRIIEQTRTLLENNPTEENQRSQWLLKLEYQGREIDAGFSENALSDELRQLREQLNSLVNG